jgi:hypothetical protein
VEQQQVEIEAQLEACVDGWSAVQQVDSDRLSAAQHVDSATCFGSVVIMLIAKTCRNLSNEVKEACIRPTKSTRQ